MVLLKKIRKKISLEKTVTFELYDPGGYDVVRLPDKKRVAIPYGFDNLVNSIDTAYPEPNAHTHYSHPHSIP